VSDPTALVIHGHFYQPPREDPWTGEVPEQPSAAPHHDWNERITEECYRPITAVDLGEAGVVNALEHMSFNVGPTLMSWLEQHAPDVYQRVLSADRAGGRGIAQGYNHAILPLCDDRDLRTQVRWGVADFRHRFGRSPEGMWLPETAVSERVLAVLAEEGVRFTILAPSQLRSVRPLQDGGAWHDVLNDIGEVREGVAVDRPFLWRHPAREDLSLQLVVYDGGLAQSLAFANPSGRDIVDQALWRAGDRGGMVAAATDGETFGHHHRGAERSLAEALVVEAPARGVRVPSLGQAIVERPPTHQARVRTSAWSCAHGVGRWATDCGCHTGGAEGWTQAWRAPLRHAFDILRDWGVQVMSRRGPEVLHDPWLARDAYVGVLVGARSFEHFAAEHVTGDAAVARALLEAQRHGMLMYTSCGWFFNDLGGIETVQVLRYAARSMDHYRSIGEHPPVDAFLDELERANSNDPAIGNGRQVWAEQVDTSRPGRP